MTDPKELILTINSGSSSIKFALYQSDTLSKIFEGKIDHIGMDDTYVFTKDLATNTETRTEISGLNPVTEVMSLLDSIIPSQSLRGIGHRVVHGETIYHESTRIDATVIEVLHTLIALAPRHLPAEIDLIEACAIHFPSVPQYACFDTGFYKNLPRVSQLLPLPREYESKGVRRYGFHGLSLEYLMAYLVEEMHESIETKKIILAHLGSGASLTAVKNGFPVDTSMGFTPASGIPMGTRSGDIDPSLFEFFTRTIGLSQEEFTHMVNYESGIKGVSGITADMEKLLEYAPRSEPATEAITFFCHQVRKQIGALSAIMGGVDMIVFTGGIGEKSAPIRKLICADLEFLGIELDVDANEDNDACISTSTSPVTLYAVSTNEEESIAKHVHEALVSTHG